MKKPATLLLVIVIASVSYVIGRRTARRSSSNASSASSGGKKILYWKAPMTPGFRSDKPGKSPMGMDLVPVYEGGEDSGPEGSVAIDPSVEQSIGVKTAPVIRTTLHRRIRTQGIVTYDESKIGHVHTKINGWVTKLHVSQTGDKVAEGDPLFEIYSPALVSSQEDYLVAIAYWGKVKNSSLSSVRDNGRSLLKASEQRLRYFDISEEQIKELAESGKVKKSMTIYSQLSGIVMRKNIFKGKELKINEEVYMIAPLDPIWVIADLYEYESPWVKEGNRVEIDSAYNPKLNHRVGKADYIYPYLDPKTRTQKVRIVFSNSDVQLKPEMYVDVNFKSSPRKNVLAVPSDAVIRTGARQVVLIDIGKGRFLPKDIKTGVEGDERVEVLSGLKEGETVVTSAQFLIDSESNLRAATGDMTSEMPPKKKDKMKGMDMKGMKKMDMKGMK